MFPLPIFLYKYIAIGAVILLLGVALKIQTARLDACHTQVEADKALIQGLGDQIKAQNEAVAALDAASKSAKAKGAKAVAAARQEAQGMAGEVLRLSELLKQASGGGKSCADGVRDARAGLGG